MLKKDELQNYAPDTIQLYSGMELQDDLNPEAAPLYLTTAFIMPNDLEGVAEFYSEKKFTYIRTRNPNRRMLEDAVSALEHSEKSLIFSSGMAAIHTSMMTFLKSGDHILAAKTLYGESIEIFAHYNNFHIEADFVDFSDLEAIKKAIKPNTKILYTETISNPKITLVDVEAVAKIAHEAKAMLFVDNTFATPYAINCMDKGADIVIESLTKFMNGHSDALLGSVSGKGELVDQIEMLQHLYGGSGGTFNSWLVLRSLRTLDIRMDKHMATADKLANALAKIPYVQKVNYPTVSGYKQKEVAEKLFDGKGYGAMLSFELKPENKKEMSIMLSHLKLAQYAPTLGGFRTTLSYPCLSSHSELTEEERLKIGIHDGLMRVSVGLENADDLIADFTQAIEKAFKG
ncbi:MAG: aminotransferase class I/II-fold pyridoxal phosphate-dependent enzyme [Clostridia bacterium]|nr:aminotransferase class I/II-fold pyridoxal phosphate-dependent enzyme [Clostridia bacterium]